MSKFSSDIFKYRSYTPIPFLLLMVIFQQPTIQTLLIGFIMVLLGEFFRLWGVSYAGSETRTTGAVGGTYLVVSGPYAFVRNPLYLGNILLYCGVGVMSNALFPYLLIVAFLFFYLQYRIIINEEEGYLIKAFGESYQKFRSNVPRLIPSIKKYADASLPQPSFNLKAGLRSERRTLQAISVVLLIIIISFIIKNYIG
ncbi:MAG TPA: isoprenylcysteine carboxylmethyltransferase family protein [Melioribacteraceae bacterium]|nr:isoprenylcysteine carboxylmethyltransferase family protein [Melioribacteraceae bacterium]